MKPASPYLTAEQAAEYLKKSVKAFHSFRYRHPRLIRARRLGRTLLFSQADLDAAMDVEPDLSLVRRRA